MLFQAAVAQSKAERYAWMGCPTSGISVWPYGDTMYSNSVILIEGIGNDQELIRGFNTKYPIYLKEGNNVFALNVANIHDGNSGVLQVLLKPEKPLQAGKKYVLHIDGISALKQYPKGPSFLKQSFAYSLHGAYGTPEFVREKEWFVLPGKEATKLGWEKLPVEEYRSSGPIQGTAEMIHFDMQAVHFAFQLSGVNNYLFRINLSELSNHKTSTFYINPEENQIIIGRGNTCIGNYYFEKGKKYEVSFDIIDVSGNEYKWENKKLEFIGP